MPWLAPVVLANIFPRSSRISSKVARAVPPGSTVALIDAPLVAKYAAICASAVSKSVRALPWMVGLNTLAALAPQSVANFCHTASKVRLAELFMLVSWVVVGTPIRAIKSSKTCSRLVRAVALFICTDHAAPDAERYVANCASIVSSSVRAVPCIVAVNAFVESRFSMSLSLLANVVVVISLILSLVAAESRCPTTVCNESSASAGSCPTVSLMAFRCLINVSELAGAAFIAGAASSLCPSMVSAESSESAGVAPNRSSIALHRAIKDWVVGATFIAGIASPLFPTVWATVCLPVESAAGDFDTPASPCIIT